MKIMKEGKKKRNNNYDVDLTVDPLPFRRAPELDGKVKFSPEKSARYDAMMKKFGPPRFKQK